MELHLIFAALCEERRAHFLRRLGERPNEDICWEWKGANDGKSGYGRFKIRSDWSAPTHRISYVLANGPIPPGMDVLHKCDNPPCCNPSHLFLGGHSDNMADMVRKGRSAGGGYPGEKNYNAKLTQEEVVRMKSLMRLGLTNKDIAPLYPQVGTAMISRIRRGKAWNRI